MDGHTVLREKNDLEQTIKMDKSIDSSSKMDKFIDSSIKMDKSIDSSIKMDKSIDSSIKMDQSIESGIKIDKSIDSGIKKDQSIDSSIKMDQSTDSGNSNGMEKPLVNLPRSTEKDRSTQKVDKTTRKLRRALANPMGQMLSKPINTLMSPFSVSATASVFSALKMALSDSKCRVRHISQVKPGDHIVLRPKKSGLVDKMIMGHHAIVKHVDEQEQTLTIIHYYSHVFEKNLIAVRLHPQVLVSGMVIESIICLNGDYNIYKVKHASFGEDTETILQRAQSRIGEQEFNFFLNNDEHFAYFCKTGAPRSCRNKLYILKMARVTIKLYTLGKSIYLLLGVNSRIKRYVYDGISSTRKHFQIMKESVLNVQEIPCSGLIYSCVNQWAFKMANPDSTMAGAYGSLKDTKELEEGTGVMDAKKKISKKTKSKHKRILTKEEKQRAVQLGSQFLARTIGHGIAEAGSKIIAEKAVEKGSFFAVSRMGARAAENMGKNAMHQAGKNAMHHAGKHAIHHVGKNAMNQVGKNAIHHVGKNALNQAGKHAVHHVGKNAVQHAAKGAVARTAVATAGKTSSHTMSGALRAASRGQGVAIGLGALVSIGFATKDIMRAKKEKKEGTMSTGEYNELVTKKVAGATTDIALATYGTVMGTVLAGPVGAIMGGIMGSMAGTIIGEEFIGKEINKSDIAPKWAGENDKDTKNETKPKLETESKVQHDKEKEENEAGENSEFERQKKSGISDDSVADEETAVNLILENTPTRSSADGDQKKGEEVEKESINELFGEYFDTLLGRSSKGTQKVKTGDLDVKEGEQEDHGTSFTSGLWSSIFGSLDDNELPMEEESCEKSSLKITEIVDQPQEKSNMNNIRKETSETSCEDMCRNAEGENEHSETTATKSATVGTKSTSPVQNLPLSNQDEANQDSNAEHLSTDTSPSKENLNQMDVLLEPAKNVDESQNYTSCSAEKKDKESANSSPLLNTTGDQSQKEEKQNGLDELFGSYFDSLRGPSQESDPGESGNKEYMTDNGKGKGFTSGIWGSLFGSLDWNDTGPEVDNASPTETMLQMTDAKTHTLGDREVLDSDVKTTIADKTTTKDVHIVESVTTKIVQCNSGKEAGILIGPNVLYNHDEKIDKHSTVGNINGDEKVMMNLQTTIVPEEETSSTGINVDDRATGIMKADCCETSAKETDLQKVDSDLRQTSPPDTARGDGPADAKEQESPSGFGLFNFNPLKSKKLGSMVGGLLHELFGDEDSGNTDEDIDSISDNSNKREVTTVEEINIASNANLTETSQGKPKVEPPKTESEVDHLDCDASIIDSKHVETTTDASTCNDKEKVLKETSNDQNMKDIPISAKTEENVLNATERSTNEDVSSTPDKGDSVSDKRGGSDDKGKGVSLSVDEDSDLFDSDDCSIGDLDAVSIDTNDLLDSDIDIEIERQLNEESNTSAQSKDEALVGDVSEKESHNDEGSERTDDKCEGRLGNEAVSSQPVQG